MLDAFIKKHSRLCALAAVLLCFVAAPYLIPENPDSAVFRSGTLGAILLAACLIPVEQAFSRADRRTLSMGLLFGFLFASALSIGAELLVYDGFLPGMGSFVRRLAVPVLAAPLLGGLCTRLMLFSPSGRTLHLPYWGYWLILLGCWTPVLLAYFPAALNYDFLAEYWQYLSQIYSTRHPLFYLIANNSLIMLGDLLNSRTLGMFLSTLAHMLPFAAALAYSCTFLQKRKAPRWSLIALTAYYGLMPVFSLMSISTSKDTVFSAALLTLSLLSFEMLEDPDAFFHNWKRCTLYVLMIVFTAHLRNNGLFAFIFLMPLLFALLRGHRKHFLALAAGGAASGLLLTLALHAAYPVTSQPSKQLLSLPAQQLVRAYHNGDLSEEERNEIASWYTNPYGLTLSSHLADNAKGYLNDEKLDAEMDDFLSLWMRIGKKCPRIYAEAALMLNMGSWYPDDISVATIYQPGGLYVGYLETQRFVEEVKPDGLNVYCFLPPVRDLIEQLCTHNRYLRYPILPLLFNTALPFWAILFAAFTLAARHKQRFIPAAAGVFGIWLSYQFGPCTLPRYILPLFCLAPVMLLTAFLAKKD